jgi:hypothetical protein
LPGFIPRRNREKGLHKQGPEKEARNIGWGIVRARLKFSRFAQAQHSARFRIVFSVQLELGFAPQPSDPGKKTPATCPYRAERAYSHPPPLFRLVLRPPDDFVAIFVLVADFLTGFGAELRCHRVPAPPHSRGGFANPLFIDSDVA